MILVDTSIWIDHLNRGDAVLSERLEQGRVLMHPCVLGELAMGSLRQREEILEALGDLPRAEVATDAEVLRFVRDETLYGVGIGYVDAQLLAAVRLTRDARLWTRDKRLLVVAERMGMAVRD